MLEDISPALEGLGCYRRQIEAIRTVVPEYGDGWKCKLVLPSVLESDGLNVTRLTVQSRDGGTRTVRLPSDAYLQLVAATNFKQRVRKMTEYYHADRLNYAVAGTPNRLEYDQGFFVKQGDGAADFKPIAHLYKTQVYQLAAYLGVAGGDPAQAADDRHVLAAADPGGVLLRAALRPDGPVPVRGATTASRRMRWRPSSA